MPTGWISFLGFAREKESLDMGVVAGGRVGDQGPRCGAPLRVLHRELVMLITSK